MNFGRCDPYGDILAFLMNVLDVDRARTAFRFMRGVGINQLWPVAHLHPVVPAGDPDWRACYTVNHEWAHGQTGRPMGKRFQAWSAAAFLCACHELEADPKSLANE